MRKQLMDSIDRIVIKIGTSVLTDGGSVNEATIRAIAKDISDFQASRTAGRIVLVTSGAIGAGLAILKIRKRPADIDKLQAIAAVGQRNLMQIYDRAFREHGRVTAQMLLTWEDLGNRKRYDNTQKTLKQLMHYGCIPIINENDTVSTQEIQFGDNDQLASMVAIMFGADLVINLSDENGLHTDYRTDKASRISMVDDMSASIFDKAKDFQKNYSKGGMTAKLAAIDKAVSSGIPCLLANGHEKEVLRKLFEGEDLGTIFLPKIKKTSSKKHWIAYISKPEGSIVVDKGAEAALLQKGKSLLSKGILQATGSFEPGSAVNLLNEDGKIIGKGILNFSSSELEKIRNLNSKEWSRVLGHPCMDEVLHRDNFVKSK